MGACTIRRPTLNVPATSAPSEYDCWAYARTFASMLHPYFVHAHVGTRQDAEVMYRVSRQAERSQGDDRLEKRFFRVGKALDLVEKRFSFRRRLRHRNLFDHRFQL